MKPPSGNMEPAAESSSTVSMFVESGDRFIAMLLDQKIALGQFQVFANHLCHEFKKSGARPTTQFPASLCRISQQRLHLGRAEVTRVDTDHNLFTVIDCKFVNAST